jgi:hypothetical protein
MYIFNKLTISLDLKAMGTSNGGGSRERLAEEGWDGSWIMLSMSKVTATFTRVP